MASDVDVARNGTPPIQADTHIMNVLIAKDASMTFERFKTWLLLIVGGLIILWAMAVFRGD